MADFYCDHGAYAAYAAVPSWGVPQDGDGKAKAPSTAAAQASITFSGIPAGNISVCGVLVSPSWVTSADVSANNLAAAINASTSLVTTAGFRPAAVQLRNAVYARGPSSGAPAGTCQIMTRHGSAFFNGLTAIGHTLTNVSAAELAFSGGASGCWGYAVNGTPMWPAAVTYYGIFGNSAPYAAESFVAGSRLFVRSGKDIDTGLLSSNLSWDTLATPGTKDAPIRIIIDDGTEWPEDAPEPKFIIRCGNSADRTFGPLTATGYFNIEAKKYSDEDYGFNLLWTTGAIFRMVTGRRGGVFTGINIEGTSNGRVMLRVSDSMGYRDTQLFSESRIKHSVNGSFLDAHSQSWNVHHIFQETIFDATGSVVPNTAGVIGASISYSPNYVRHFDSPRFIGFVPGSRLYPAATYMPGRHVEFFRNPDFGDVSVLGPIYGSTGSTSVPMANVVASSSQFNNRDFFIDTPMGYVEWNSARSFPTCNAKLLDGVTPWAIRIIPTIAADNVSRTTFAETPRISKVNSLPSGTRTITVELAIHESLDWNKSHLSAVIDYMDTDGGFNVVDSYDYDAGALDVSTASWSQEVSGQVTYVDGATQYHNKKKFSVAVPTAIQTGTEIGIVIRCHGYVSDTTKGVFIDPEIQVV